MSKTSPLLPKDIINKITNYNVTRYPNNRLTIRRIGDSYDYTDYTDPTGTLSFYITIRWDENIDYEWREYAGESTRMLWPDPDYYEEDLYREINSTIERLPGSTKTIFGDDNQNGLHEVYVEVNDATSIDLRLDFWFDRESDGRGGYALLNRMDGGRGTKLIREIFRLAALVMVKTMKNIISPGNAPLASYMTYDRYGNVIGESSDLKQHIKAIKWSWNILSFSKWKNLLSIREVNRTFTLVNNKRLPLSRGVEAPTMRQLKF